MLKKINIILYILTGTITLLIGSIALLKAPDHCPVVSGEAQNEVVHIIREAGSAAIFIGLVTFWCAFNYSKSRNIHNFLLVFFVLISAVHWMDYAHGIRPLSSGLINTVPVVIFGLMGMMRRR